MRFLKLADPLEVRHADKQHDVQADSKRFEGMVHASCLRYWRPSMSFDQTEGRLLIGLAASASLLELRLAELLNEQLAAGLARCTVDVFNLQDIKTVEDTAKYFTQTINIVSTPVAAFWQNGRLIDLSQGGKATMMCMQRIGMTGSFERMMGRLCPPDPTLNDY